MKNRYKKAFDEISPMRSDEELLRAVLDRKAENMKITRKIGKKAIAIPVAGSARRISGIYPRRLKGCSEIGARRTAEKRISALIFRGSERRSAKAGAARAIP